MGEDGTVGHEYVEATQLPETGEPTPGGPAAKRVSSTIGSRTLEDGPVVRECEPEFVEHCHPTPAVTTGEGGMVMNGRDVVATGVRHVITPSRSESCGSTHELVADDFRTTGLATAIDRADLEGRPSVAEGHRENALRLRVPSVTTDPDPSVEPKPVRQTHDQDTGRTRDRGSLGSYRSDLGIGAVVQSQMYRSTLYHPNCTHEQPTSGPLEAAVLPTKRAPSGGLSRPFHRLRLSGNTGRTAEVPDNHV